jgi:lambda repressor-like predicted transcriptional regulator
VAGLVPSRRGPKGASKLTPELVKRIAGLDAAGATLRQIAAATGVSTFSVRNALGRVASSGRPAAAGVTGIRPPGTVSRARARFGCCRIRCPGAAQAIQAIRAIQVAEPLLADMEQIFGPDLPDTLQTRNYLAGAYRAAGRPPRRSRCTSGP